MFPSRGVFRNPRSGIRHGPVQFVPPGRRPICGAVRPRLLWATIPLPTVIQLACGSGEWGLQVRFHPVWLPFS